MFRHMMPKMGDPAMFERPTPVGFFFEPKLDGIRVFIYKEKDNLTIVNQQGIDITFKFPELLDLPIYIKPEKCVLDGIITVLKEGRPDSKLIQKRELAETSASIRNRTKRFPVTLFVFDILEFGKAPLTQDWIKKRKEILEKTVKNSDIIQIMPSVLNGRAVWEEIKEKNYFGVVAKTINGKYLEGINWGWLKIKHREILNAIIIGYTEEEFLLAVYNPYHLKYIGSVKKDKDLKTFFNKKIKFLKSKTFLAQIPKSKWLKPAIVAKIEHKGWEDGKLKNPRLLRVCLDKHPDSCVIKDEI
ncbi:MAG: ATP-dependent DNA ligase [archaeon]|nr:MAG: ATP-dependent DNA ligase [archaeon]